MEAAFRSIYGSGLSCFFTQQMAVDTIMYSSWSNVSRHLCHTHTVISLFMQCSRCSQFTGWWCLLLCHTHCYLTVHAVFTVHGVVMSAALSHTLSSHCFMQCSQCSRCSRFTGWWCPLLCHTHCHLTVHAVFTVDGVVVSAALSHTLSSDCHTHCHLTVHAVFTMFTFDGVVVSAALSSSQQHKVSGSVHSLPQVLGSTSCSPCTHHASTFDHHRHPFARPSSVPRR